MCRFSHFYATNIDAVLGMPIRRFWFMNGCIERVAAQNDIRSLTIAAMAQSTGEAGRNYHDRLVLNVGEIYTYSDEYNSDKGLPNAERDQAGFEELKRIAAEQI